MSEGKQQQDIASQGWQKADARILGQILAAQNVVFTLPDTIRITEFYAQILISIPGIAGCRVCLGGKSVQAGEMAGRVCAECETLRHLAREDGTPIPTTSSFTCNLADQTGMRVLAVDSDQHRFGFFVFKVDQAVAGELYQPFIGNLSAYVAMILENRWQKNLLQKAHDELEHKVEERTHELAVYHEHLEELVRERTAELEQANKELNAFAYTVSHDLRAPLRHIDGFIGLLQKNAGTVINEQGRQYMAAISDSAERMERLIDDLLSFSRMGRQVMVSKPVQLGTLVRDVIRELEPDTAGRTIAWRIAGLPEVSGDASLLRVVLSNLISNALKFTRSRQQAQIEIGAMAGQASEAVIFVRDNGVGFDMTNEDKLFGVFQRLHRVEEFVGTGIGLATVRRIIDRHGGRTWAEGEPEQGATFYFALPLT